ncbi:killer cell lectin-like receptor subfamily F member 2 [Lithobates pipiens]
MISYIEPIRPDITVQQFRILLVLSDMEIKGKCEKELWRPSWKGVIITLLVASNIILIRIIEVLGQVRDGEIGMMEIKKQLCVNTSEELAECTLCPGGWLRHRENCYNISSGGGYRTWKESRKVCEELGADLLVIKDRGQEEFIKRFSRLQAGQAMDMFWIGLYRDGDGWRWVDGHLYNTGLFQILGDTSGDCIQMHATVGYYSDDCQSKQNWICQRRALKI